MESASPTATAPNIHSSIALFEESSGSQGKPPTKAIRVSWGLSQPMKLGDGEWSVNWDGMDVAVTTADEGYGSLTSGSVGPSSSIEGAAPDGGDVPFANGAAQLESLADSFFEKIFNDRAIVQSPTKVLPGIYSTSPVSPTLSSSRFSVLFLLSASTPLPSSITVRFNPTWSSPIAPSPAASIPVTKGNSTDTREIHRLWAKSRLADLRELQELADELTQTGKRGMGTGTMKVGVDGGGHDEERLRWEAEMVGRERNWVLKRFLGSLIEGTEPNEFQNDKNGIEQLENEEAEDMTEEKEIERGLELLGKLAKGLKLSNNPTETPAEAPTNSAPSCRSIAPQSSRRGEDIEDDLFALPLSPRSPDMALSPFSRFREPAVGNLDSTLLSTNTGFIRRAPPSSLVITSSKDAIMVDSGTPSTPTLMGSPNPEDMRRRRAAGAALGIGG